MAAAQDPIGVTSAVKIEKPLVISAALGVKVGSKSKLPVVEIVPGEEADHSILATLVKWVMATCPGVT